MYPHIMHIITCDILDGGWYHTYDALSVWQVQERAAAAEGRAELAAAVEEEVFSIKPLPSAFLSAVLLRGP